MTTPRRPSGRSQPPDGAAAILVPFGLVLMLLGGGWSCSAIRHDPNAPVLCNDRVMHPGDKCIVISGPGRDRTYEEMKAARVAEPNYVAGPALLATGALLIVAPGLRGGRGRGRGAR
jgi:hypothetical protein